MVPPSCSTVPNGSSNNTHFLPVPKRLHYILMGSLVPSWAFGLPLVIFDATVWSILALIFATFSSIISLYRVRKEETYEYQIRLPGDDEQEQQANNKNAGLFAWVDFVLAVGMVSWIILSFIESSVSQNGAVHFLMAYVSMVWFTQCFLHFYFLFRYVKHGVRSFFRRSRKTKSPVLCDHCHNPICEDEGHSSSPGQVAESAVRGREALV